MPMKPFIMEEMEREMVANYIEKYHLTENRGKFQFQYRNKTYPFINFGSMTSPVSRSMTYLMLRQRLHEILTNMSEAVRNESMDQWKEWLHAMPGPYSMFMDFIFENADQVDVLLNDVLAESESFPTPLEKVMNHLNRLLDFVGMADHAARYGTYLVAEFQDLISNEEYDELLANQDKFPVIMKRCNSKEEADQFIERVREKEQQKIKQEKESDEYNLKNMPAISRSIN